MDPIAKLLNALIAQNLPKLNQIIQNAIVSGGMDPWGNVASGSDNLGSIDLGICTASASANYYIANLTGLAGFAIQRLEITGSAPVHDNPAAVSGTISLHGAVGGMSAGVGGKFKAGCGFISQSMGISGTAHISGATVVSGGDFMASTDKGQLTLNHLDVENLTVNYDGLNVDIDGLGIFNSMLGPLTNLIVGQFQGPIRDAIASAITPVINNQIGGVLPLSTSL